MAEPRELPILFSPAMAAAVHEGRKTQTRRIAEGHTVPKYSVGDRLWVREVWRPIAWGENGEPFIIEYKDGVHRQEIGFDLNCEAWRESLWISVSDELNAMSVPCDEKGIYWWEHGKCPLRWRSSIHMPKWCSRTWIEVTEVRSERVQDISEADAKAEGISFLERADPGGPCIHCRHSESEHVGVARGCFGASTLFDGRTYSGGFRVLWDSIHGDGAWARNDWVFVYSFRRIDRA